MNVLRMPRLFAGLTLIAAILSGCATPQPIPDVLQPQSSGLGIQVTLKAPVGIFSNSPSQVYFARIDDGGGMLQQSIIRSNYVKGDRAYLLNAPPGTYAAVGAFFSRGAVPAAPQAPGVSVSINMGRTGYTTYFSKELVEQTRMTIGTNDFVFIGSYVVDQSVGLEGADAVQIHYQNVIAPGATTGGFLHLMGGDYHYRGTLIERKNDEQARDEFVRNAKEDLAGSGWAARVR